MTVVLIIIAILLFAICCLLYEWFREDARKDERTRFYIYNIYEELNIISHFIEKNSGKKFTADEKREVREQAAYSRNHRMDEESKRIDKNL